MRRRRPSSVHVLRRDRIAVTEESLPVPDGWEKSGWALPHLCQCSLGYVKEMHEQMFKKPVEVEPLSSVLYGDLRCKFKITVSS